MFSCEKNHNEQNLDEVHQPFLHCQSADEWYQAGKVGQHSGKNWEQPEVEVHEGVRQEMKLFSLCKISKNVKIIIKHFVIPKCKFSVSL